MAYPWDLASPEVVKGLQAVVDGVLHGLQADPPKLGQLDDLAQSERVPPKGRRTDTPT